MSARFIQFARTFITGLLIVVALSAPLVSLAQRPPFSTGGGTGTTSAATETVTTGSSAAETPAASEQGWFGKFWSYFTGKAGDLLQGTVIVSVLSDVIDYASRISPFGSQYTSCTATEACVGRAINSANRFILNLVNLFYILVLLLIAIAQIFGVESYSVQRMLPKLILAILLSTFGIFFVKLAADTAQLLTNGLLPSTGLAQQLLSATGTKELLTQSITEKTLFVIPIAGWILVVLYELLNPLNWFAVAFLVVAVILVFRIAGLWVLSIIAPFGVAFGVMPQTQPYAKMYWRKVLSYAFIGPILIFFLRLAIIVYSAAQASPATSFASLKNLESILPINPQNFIAAALAFMIIVFGIAVTRKLGVEVANFTIGAFQKAFKLAFGASVAAGTLAAGAGFAIATKNVAPGVLSRFFGRRGVSEGAQEDIGIAGQYLSARLKGSGIPLLSTAAAKLEKPFQDLAAKQEKAASPASRNAAVDKEYERMMAVDKDGYEERAKANPAAFLAEGASKATEAERGAYYRVLQAVQKVTESGELGDADPKTGKREVKNLKRADVERELRLSGGLNAVMQSNLAEYDPRANRNVINAAPGVERQRAMDRAISAIRDKHQISDVALGSQEVMKSLERVMRPSRLDRSIGRDPFNDLLDKMNIYQRRAVGVASGKAAREAKARGNAEGLQKYGFRATRYGQDPTKIFDKASIANLGLPPAVMRQLQAAADAMLKAASSNAKNYKDQTPSNAINMIVNVTNPEKISEIMKNVSASVKYELRREAKKGTTSRIVSEAVRQAILGNILSSKTAPATSTTP